MKQSLVRLLKMLFLEVSSMGKHKISSSFFKAVFYLAVIFLHFCLSCELSDLISVYTCLKCQSLLLGQAIHVIQSLFNATLSVLHFCPKYTSLCTCLQKEKLHCKSHDVRLVFPVYHLSILVQQLFLKYIVQKKKKKGDKNQREQVKT